MSAARDSELTIEQERFHRALLRRYAEAQQTLDPLSRTAFQERGALGALFDAAST